MLSLLRTMWRVFIHSLRRRETVKYPEVKPAYPERARGRIVLTKSADGNERCVGCYLCSAVCPVNCISLEAAEDSHGRRYPKKFKIDFSRCIFCGLCEEACPTYAIQLTPDFKMSEYKKENLVYEKEDLLIDGPGKFPDYDFYKVSGLAIRGKDKGEAENEEPPVDVRSLMP